MKLFETTSGKPLSFYVHQYQDSTNLKKLIEVFNFINCRKTAANYHALTLKYMPKLPKNRLTTAKSRCLLSTLRIVLQQIGCCHLVVTAIAKEYGILVHNLIICREIDRTEENEKK